MAIRYNSGLLPKMQLSAYVWLHGDGIMIADACTGGASAAISWGIYSYHILKFIYRIIGFIDLKASLTAFR